MNTLQFDQGTMAGMTDGHFIASVEPLLMTLLEKELFKRLVEHEAQSELIGILEDEGLDNAIDCPSKSELDAPIDDALYLIDQTVGEAREVATKLHKYLTTFREDLK